MTEERILITGGGGFIGSHLAHALAAEGYHILILDNLIRGRAAYVKDLIDGGRATLTTGDIRDWETVEAMTRGVRFVFHEAAVCINYSVANPSDAFDVNVRGSYNVFKAAKQAGVEKVIFSSSASVYGNSVYLPMDEAHPFNPITPYCISKIANEYTLRMSEFSAMPFVIFRNFNVYGPRQSTDAYYTSVIIMFAKRLLHGLAPQVHGDGRQSYDYIHIDDLVRANLKVLETRNADRQSVNLGTGVSTSVFEVAARMIALSDHKELKPVFIPEDKPNIVQVRRADCNKARRLLGFKAGVSLDEGLASVMADVAANESMY